MVMVPEMPASAPVPEPGTTETVSWKLALVHDAEVLESEGAGAAFEGSGDVLDGDVACAAILGVAGAEHFAFAGGVKITVILL